MKKRSEVLFLVTSLVMFLTVSFSHGMSVVGYAKKGEECLNKKQYSEAIRNLSEAIKKGGLSAEDMAIIYTNRGIAYSAKKKYDSAVKDYNKAIELSPGYAKAYYNKACLYSLKNDAAEACKWLSAAIEKGFNDWGHIKTDSAFNNIIKASCYKGIMSGR